MKFVNFAGDIVTAEDDGRVVLNSKVIAFRVEGEDDMVKLPRQNLLDLLNTPEIQQAASKTGGQ